MLASATTPVQYRGEGEESGKFLESGHALPICATPLLPEVDNDSEHRARVEHDQKQGHGRRRWIEAHQLLRHDHMSRTRHRQKFGQSLQDGEHDHLRKWHVPILIGLGVNLYTREPCLIQTILPLGSFAGIARRPLSSERQPDGKQICLHKTAAQPKCHPNSDVRSQEMRRIHALVYPFAHPGRGGDSATYRAARSRCRHHGSTMLRLRRRSPRTRTPARRGPRRPARSSMSATACRATGSWGKGPATCPRCTESSIQSRRVRCSGSSPGATKRTACPLGRLCRQNSAGRSLPI